MKKKKYIQSFYLGVLLLVVGNTYSHAQTFSDSLRHRMPQEYISQFRKVDEYFRQADELYAKGMGISIENIPADSVWSEVDLIDQMINYKTRFDASLYYKRAIKLKFKILNEQIQAFWKAHPESRNELRIVSLIESAAFDSILLADELRAQADKSKLPANKLSLLARAEMLEKTALFDWEKLLYTYLTWPQKPDIPWILSADADLPLSSDSITALAALNLTSIEIPGQRLKAPPTSIYGMLDIKEQQVDQFNDFMLREYPGKVEQFVLDYRAMKPGEIEDLKEEWQHFSYDRYQASDTVLPLITATETPGKIAFNLPVEQVSASATRNERDLSRNVSVVARPESIKEQAVVTNTEVSRDAFTFKVQIAACKSKIDRKALSAIYRGNLKISESFEDGWYKYTIGSFTKHTDARKLRSNTHVKGVFIASYLNGKRIQVTPALKKRFYSGL